jgi:protein gp37
MSKVGKISTIDLDLDLIRIDGGTQPRTEIGLDIVAEYCSAMLEGDEFPSLQVMHDGVDYWLWDGFHRYHAAKMAELSSVKCVVTTGTLRAAILASVGTNRTHGQRRTRQDVRNAIERLLKDDEWGKRSDRWIAEQVGCDHKTVSGLRESTGEIPQLNDRIGQDGKTRSLPQRHPQEREQAEQVESNFPAEINANDEEKVFSLPIVQEVKQGLAGYVTLDEWNGMSTIDKNLLETRSNNTGKRFNDQNDNENIEWALWSWNPVTGCEHNCPYCYARDIANRFYEQKFVPSFWPERLHAPFNTPFPEAKAKEWIGHKNVFTCSMADLFGRWVPKEWIDAVLDAVRLSPQWNFLFLSKFPQRMAEFDFPDNAWVGTTVDCQARVANAEKAFAKIKAKVKWLSCEPMIEPLNFKDLSMFSWVVIGGSSRSAETPEWHPPRRWVRDLQDKCDTFGIPYYEKSNLLERIRLYPGDNPNEVQKTVPCELQYLPTKGKK